MTATADAPYTPGPNAVDITPDKDGGVLKEIVTEGVGDALPGSGCNITCHYHGTLTDGTVFDSSKERGKPFEFQLGKGNVIKAWDLGVATMKKGEVALLTCSSEYAYGKGGSPPKIPPNATLIFEITLISWQEEDLSKSKDGGILRTILVKGEGYATPNDGALCEVHITGSYNGKQFEDRDVSFNLGEGSESGIVEGVERALEKFKKGEKSRLTVKAKYGYGNGNPELGIPADATVTFVVELKQFEKAKPAYDMDATEKLQQAKLIKDKAASYYKESKLALAAKLYQKILDFVDTDVGFSGDEDKEREAILLAARLNLGLVYLKDKKPYDAISECEKAIGLDKDNVKAFFRRGQAYLEVNEPEKAKADFEVVVKLEPANKLAASQIVKCDRTIRQQHESERKIYANMFEKFATQDKEKEESFRRGLPDTMKVLGEWGKDEREREPTVFEQENPDIILLNKDDQFKNM